MADSNLNEPVIIQATRLDTSVLPRNIFVSVQQEPY